MEDRNGNEDQGKGAQNAEPAQVDTAEAAILGAVDLPDKPKLPEQLPVKQSRNGVQWAIIIVLAVVLVGAGSYGYWRIHHKSRPVAAAHL